MEFSPTSTPGKWSVGLAILSVLLFVFMMILVSLGQEGGDKFTDNLLLSIPGIASGGAVVLAGLTGLFALIRLRERAITVFASTLIGLIALVFIVGEFVSPH